jgi:hypothetical protein
MVKGMFVNLVRRFPHSTSICSQVPNLIFGLLPRAIITDPVKKVDTPSKAKTFVRQFRFPVLMKGPT